MSVLWKKIEFCGKSAVIAALDLGCNLSSVSGSKFFLLFNIFKVSKQLIMTLEKLYSWPKKLYQFITNLFFQANIPTSGRL